MAKKIRQLAKPDGTVWSLPAGTLHQAEIQLYKALGKDGAGVMGRLAKSGDFCREAAQWLQKVADPSVPWIDCDAYPFVPDGWKVCSHKKNGKILWDPSRVTLYFSKQQKNRQSIEGNYLCEELKSMPVLNACILDYLISHPQLIPKEWQRLNNFFWGTLYYDFQDAVMVRCLSWIDGRWHPNQRWIIADWDDRCPALLLED